tara:strand:- start:869 stop:1057 length:189 start_codon:yes stop_codon:yes gene_type:complete
MYLKGKTVMFLEPCGPIPKGSKALCLEVLDKNGVIRIWLLSSVYGVNEFVISKKHISKIKII